MSRLTVTLLLVVLIAIFGLGLALDTLFERYNAHPDDEFLPVQTLASGFASILDRSDNPDSAVSHWPETLPYRATLDSTDALSLPASLKTAFEAGEPLMLESEESVALHYYLPSHDKVLIINTPLATDPQNKSVAILFTALFYLGTLVLVLLWLKPLLSRLNILRKTTRQFGKGELTSRVPHTGISYIRDIESNFNGMADQIQQLIDDNKLLASAVSHDLRTPLARLRFGVDTLAESEDSAARAQYHQRISRDLTEMENLVNSLLRYARLDNVLDDVSKAPVSLRQLVHECTAQYYDSKVLVRIDDSALDKNDELVITGCIEHLATAFNNLIQNAIEYGNNKLIIQLQRTAGSIRLSFHDDGPGIPEHQRSDLLKPFQRGADNAGDGYGLGLAVVERIARHHNAGVSIDTSELLGGAELSVSFTETRA